VGIIQAITTMKTAIDAMISAAVLGTILCADWGCAIDRDNGSLRRKRNENMLTAPLPRRAVSANEFRLVPEEQMKLDPEEHLDDLWSRAMAVEEGMKLDERLLQMSASYSLSFSFSFSMSMPSKPPASAPSGSSFPSSTPSLDPSPNDCLDGISREEYLSTYLSTVTDPDLLDDPSTPQGQAFNWIVGSDPLAIDPCTYPTTAQRYGLATFYYATAGADWIKSDDWLGGSDECEWFGITCGEKSKTNVEKLQLCKLNEETLCFLDIAFLSVLTLLEFDSIEWSRRIYPE
jgi:hypothetical protein